MACFQLVQKRRKFEIELSVSLLHYFVSDVSQLQTKQNQTGISLEAKDTSVFSRTGKELITVTKKMFWGGEGGELF